MTAGEQTRPAVVRFMGVPMRRRGAGSAPRRGKESMRLRSMALIALLPLGLAGCVVAEVPPGPAYGYYAPPARPYVYAPPPPRYYAPPPRYYGYGYGYRRPWYRY